MNPLISPVSKRSQRCRAPKARGTVSRYALRYALYGTAKTGAAQRQPR